jgi:tellurite resistance protein
MQSARPRAPISGIPQGSELSTIFDDDMEFEPDTPEAVLRCAVAVACCDGVFAFGEQDRVRSVYDDICQEMTFAYNRPEVSDDYQDIAESTGEYVLSLSDEQVRLNYIEYCGSLISDRDLQEMALIMSMRVAGGDAELDDAEFRALRSLANLWQINLSDVLEPYLS